jgi:chaperonin cofactor prefoldin
MSDDTNGSASQNGEGVTVEALQQQLTEIVAERDGMKTKLRTLESASSELKKLTAERDNLLVEKSNIYSQLETF